MTNEALKRIAALYAIEAEIRGHPPGEGLTTRKERTVPLMQSLHDWVMEQMKTLSVYAEMANAFTYRPKQWNALNEYCCNGQGEIDNNTGENALRAVAVGRKNIISSSALTTVEMLRYHLQPARHLQTERRGAGRLAA